MGKPRFEIGNRVDKTILDQNELPRWNVGNGRDLILEHDRRCPDQYPIVRSREHSAACLLVNGSIGGGECSSQRLIRSSPMCPAQLSQDNVAGLGRKLVSTTGLPEWLGRHEVAPTSGTWVAREVNRYPLPSVGWHATSHCERKG